MAANRQEQNRAEARSRKDDGFAALRLCVRFCSNAAFVLCFALLIRCGVLWLTPDALQDDPDGYLRLATNLSTIERSAAATRYPRPIVRRCIRSC